MTEKNQNNEYILPGSDDESRRLERQAKLYGGTAFIDPFLDRRVERVAELGCGSGYFSHHVAKTLPAAKIAGLDIDEKRVAFARRLYDAENLSFQTGDLTTLPFGDDELDLVFTRFVLVHYPDPSTALKEMARVVRPGGTIVAYDMVHSGVWFSPPKPAFQKVLSAAMNVMRGWNMEPDQGLHLPVAFEKAGIAQVQTQVIPHFAMNPHPLFEEYRYNWEKTIEGIESILASDFDRDLVEEACTELKPSNEPSFITEITVLVSGTVE